MDLTPEQIEAILVQKERWPRVGNPEPMIGGDGAVVVRVENEAGHGLWLAIEKNGYTHS